MCLCSGCSASAIVFLTERLMPEASWRLAFKNVRAASVFAKWMTDDNMKEKSGRGGRKQEPEWLTGEERGQELDRGIMM